MTNVPFPTFSSLGFVAPTESAILTGVLEDFNAAFGGGMNFALTSPQGQLASSLTAIIGNANDNFLFYTTQTDPAYAMGRMQDAIARIYFLERNPSQPTVVQCLCTGLPGVVIPVGALAQNADGNIYTCTEAGTIPVGGSITLTFACNTVGPIVCPSGTLNSIYQAIPGWDSINNISDGVLGNETETRDAFEARRKASVAQNSNGSLPSILGAVLSVSGVLDAYVTENTANTNATIGGVSLAPHSLYVAVVGGAAADVARAIWSHKAPGCGYNGNTTVSVQDNNSGYNPPYPTYSVTYEIPPVLPILFSVNISNNALVPANAVTQIQNAIISAFAGGDGGARARIGDTIYASRFYSALSALGSWVQIISIKIGSNNAPSASFTASVAGSVMTVSSVASGVLAVGQTVSDITGNLIPGTTITSLGTGSGGTGTYNLSNSKAVASEAMVSAVAANNSVSVNINQSPTINANNIQVTLT